MSRPSKISLSLTSNYASSWGLWEGARELVQNWHDGVYEAFEYAMATGKLELGADFKFVQTDKQGFNYEATVSNGLILGTLSFDQIQNKLKLTNKYTSLHKRILLLGYSKKSQKREVIGQFGEGLKIGALSLVREGRVVSMETGDDRWYFELVHDEAFGEKVLTVIVADRIVKEVETSGDETCTTVTMQTEEWLSCCKKFLFLCPVQKFVKTEAGSLLLDEHLKGQLYVKGVWVADLTAEDLFSGVDFANLQLDRDRNAVPKPSEVDHMVSCLWVKAIKERPELAWSYFDILAQDKYRDVKQALQYMDESAIQVIADTFLQKHGSDVFPLSQSATMSELNSVRDQLQKNVVLCSNTLLEILRRSGFHPTLEEALAAASSDAPRLPVTSLSPEQRGTLLHAVKLVQLADKTFGTSLVDIVENRNAKCCVLEDSRVKVPSWFLDPAQVHRHLKLCTDTEVDNCMCCEVQICQSILSVRPPSCANLVTTSNFLLFILEPLSWQLCNAAQSVFCSEVHEMSNESTKDHTECTLREEELHKQIERLKVETDVLAADVNEKRKKLLQKVQKLEKEVTSQEISTLNAENKLKLQYEKQLQLVRDKTLSQVQKLEQDIVHLKTKNKSLEEQVSVLEKRCASKEENILEEMLQYIELCRDKGVALQKLCRDKADAQDEGDVKEQYMLAAEMFNMATEGLQKERLLCAICIRRRKDTVLHPCGHYQLCSSCVADLTVSHQPVGRDPVDFDSGLQLPKCPTCKTVIENYTKVYE